MGVPKLWDVLTDTADNIGLAQLAYRAALSDDLLLSSSKKYYHVGIDASIWMFQARNVVQGSSSETFSTATVFFNKLIAFSKLPVKVLCVFDGPDRPKFKRGKYIVTGIQADRTTKSLKALITAFGWEIWQAPGEAEAELAALCARGQLDAVLTEDVDALVFGSPLVIRQLKKKDSDRFEAYSLSTIQKKKKLDRNGLILVALLAGGDYDDGLKDCGTVIAAALAELRYGEDLVKAYQTKSHQEMKDDFLPEYLAKIRAELRTNASGKFKMKHKALADKIDDRFPDLNVLESYVNPKVSPDSGDKSWRGFKDTTDVGFALARPVQLMKGIFDLTTEEAVMKKLLAVMLEGASLRALLKEIESRGSWERDCARFKVPFEKLQTSVDDYFGKTKGDADRGGAKGILQSQPSSSFTSSSADTSQRYFSPHYPFILGIVGERVALEGGYEKQYRCVTDPKRFVVEARAGLREGFSDLDPGAQDKPLAPEPRSSQASTCRVYGAPTTDPPSDADYEAEENGDTSDDDYGAGAAVDEAASKKRKRGDPEGTLRLWLPAAYLVITYAVHVDEYEAKQQVKRDEKAAKAQRKEDREEKKRNPPVKAAAPPQRKKSKKEPESLTEAQKGIWQKHKEEAVKNPRKEPAVARGSAAEGKGKGKGRAISPLAQPPLARGEVITISDSDDDEPTRSTLVTLGRTKVARALSPCSSNDGLPASSPRRPTRSKSLHASSSTASSSQPVPRKAAPAPFLRALSSRSTAILADLSSSSSDDDLPLPVHAFDAATPRANRKALAVPAPLSAARTISQPSPSQKKSSLLRARSTQPVMDLDSDLDSPPPQPISSSRASAAFTFTVASSSSTSIATTATSSSIASTSRILFPSVKPRRAPANAKPPAVPSSSKPVRQSLSPPPPGKGRSASSKPTSNRDDPIELLSSSPLPVPLKKVVRP